MTAGLQSRACAEARTDNFVFSPVRGRNRAKSFELVPAARAGISMGVKPAEHARTNVTSEAALLAWIDLALPGDVLEYHRGFLALDSHPQGTRLSERDRTVLLRVARQAWRAAEQQLIHLVQRRHGEGDYSYRAIARLRPACAPASRSQILLREAA
jgi:hypothetical protein